MKALVVSIVVSLGIGILVGYAVFGGKPGPAESQQLFPAETEASIGAQASEEALTKAKTAPVGSSSARPPTATKGSTLKAVPKITGKTAADIEAEKKVRAELLAAKLPQDTTAIRKMATQEDPQSVAKTVAVYTRADASKKTAIEISARDNAPLKAKLISEIEKGYAAEKAEIRASSVKSAVRMKAFDEVHRTEVRPLLKDENIEVRNEAIAHAGWSQDKEAYNDVLDILKREKDEKAVISSLHCLGVIGRGKTGELAPILAAKLQDPSPRVRQAGISCVLHLRDAVQNKEIRGILEGLAANDDYAVEVNGKTNNPIREQAVEVLKIYKRNMAANTTDSKID